MSDGLNEDELIEIDFSKYSDGLEEFDNPYPDRKFKLKKADSSETKTIEITVRTFLRKEKASETLINPEFKNSTYNHYRALEKENKLYFLKVVVLAFTKKHQNIFGISSRNKEVFEKKSFSLDLKELINRHNMIENSIDDLKMQLSKHDLY